MNEQQRQAVVDRALGKVDNAHVLRVFGVTIGEIPLEVFRELERANRNRDPEGVEFACTLGWQFSFPSGAIELIHDLLLQDWHHSHEDMISFLQLQHSPSSVSVLRRAIALKPSLEYLNYDDYGAYYKKCLWALQAIGTSDAISVIEECTKSQDAALREQAIYRMSKIGRGPDGQ